MSWLRVGKAAAACGVSACTVRRWINNATIPSVALLPVGKVQFRVAAWWCEAYASRQQQAQAAAAVDEEADSWSALTFSTSYTVGSYL
jgi:predicted site-specific integrase-resolvase